MRIGVLAWGSLQWDPRELKTASAFAPTGPVLPIEFSRISGRESPSPRLTLVIDEVNGAACKTSVALSGHGDLDFARENLRAREGMQHVNGVGYVDGLRGDTSFRAMERHPTAVGTIRDWLTTTEYDAVIWTALASNFAEARGEPFSTDAAVGFLERLSNESLIVALEYFRHAPEQIWTPVREEINKRWP